MKVAAVRGWLIPCNVGQLQSFLRLPSHYRDFPTIASPLHQLTQKGQAFQWNENCTAAFNQLWSGLTEALVLPFPNPQLFILDTDASNLGLGAVLSQEGEHSKQEAVSAAPLSHPENNYCVTLRELLAVILGIDTSGPEISTGGSSCCTLIVRFSHLAAELQKAGQAAGLVAGDAARL